MPQSFSALYEHIVFSTKHRLPQITDDFRPRLYEYLGGIVRERNCTLLRVGGMPDHIHLLVSISRETTTSPLVRDIKAIASGWIHDNFRQDFTWQAGYAVFSVSHSLLDRARAYLDNQAEHHRVRSFKEELIELLQRHQIPYDERYIFE